MRGAETLANVRKLCGFARLGTNVHVAVSLTPGRLSNCLSRQTGLKCSKSVRASCDFLYLHVWINIQCNKDGEDGLSSQISSAFTEAPFANVRAECIGLLKSSKHG
jgi:hypothetical protein